MACKEYTISEDYLKDLIDFNAKKVVGKAMKRFELTDNVDVLKSFLKELMYESYRDFRDQLMAYNKGREVTIFKFKSRKV